MQEVHVPHRNSLPTTQLGSPYTFLSPTKGDTLERAHDLVSEQLQDYSGYPVIQAELLDQAVDDINFSDEVEAAALRITGLTKRTSLYSYCGLSVKDETEQPTKAYKVRGAANFILKYADQARLAGVVTASAGNHGQAVALAASSIGVEAVVVVPAGTPNIKKDGIAAQGGVVVEYGVDYAAANRRAHEINFKQQGLYVPAFNDRDIMAGQATMARELLAQSEDFANLVVPVGGGGLIAGVARYLSVHCPSIKVFGAGVAGGSAAETAFLCGNAGHTNANRFADRRQCHQQTD